MSRFPRPHRVLLLGLAVASLAVASAVGTEAATAAKPCAQRVIGDWFDDGRVNKIYPLKCYTQAIKNLPPDVLIYGNAEDEIGRALAYAKQGKPDPGGKDPSPTQTGTTKTGTTKTGTTKTGTTSTDTTSTNASSTDTSGPSAVPIPLLVLGGLAVLLLAAGSAGYLRRRMNGDGDDDGSAAPPSGL